jgi:probable F420-dependent oxidoreductase
MRVGISFPHQAIGADPVAIRDWAQASEDLGFDHLIVYEHVIGPDPDLHPGETFRYPNRTRWHEPLVMCGFLAAATQRIGLQTGILLLPLHETVIVAKQAAEVDVLSGGRLRLGVGAGHMASEFSALGRDFHTRGARLDEQMALLRALWTSDAVTFNGREHHIDGAGLNPLPVQRPIPLWAGGGVRATVRRAARYGDGWITPGHYVGRPVDDEARQLLGWLHEEAQAAGRRPEELGIQGVIGVGRRTEDEWAAWAESWRNFGATDLLIDTGVTATSPDPSLNTAQAQIQALRRLAAVLGVG